MFPLTITSIDKILFEGPITAVTCPGTEGELTVLKSHTPLITFLKEGEIRVRINDDVKTFPIREGFLAVHKHEVAILV